MPADCDSSSGSLQQTASEVDEPPSTAGWLMIDVVPDAGDWSTLEPVQQLVGSAAAALADAPQFAGHGLSEACVALSDDANVRSLNASYRGKDQPTNVLSFPAGSGPRDGVIPLGDIVLAVETIAREAQEQGISPAQHLQHLVVHGLLHLLGYDHETNEEAEQMESIEIAVLSSLGIPNPYTEPPEARN
jgi:probable rRNA maturation factor